MISKSLFYGMGDYFGSTRKNTCKSELVKNNYDPEIRVSNQLIKIIDATSEISDDTKSSLLEFYSLSRMGDAYQYAKEYGVNKTFVNLFSASCYPNEICHIKYPACESIPAVGNPHSKYSMAFIAAMEDDSGEHKSWWQKIWGWIQDAWKWVKDKVMELWHRILEFFNLRAKDLSKLLDDLTKKYGEKTALRIAEKYKIAAILDGHGSFLRQVSEFHKNINYYGDTLLTKTDELTKKINSVVVSNNNDGKQLRFDEHLAISAETDFNSYATARTPTVEKIEGSLLISVHDIKQVLSRYIPEFKKIVDDQNGLKEEAKTQLSANANLSDKIDKMLIENDTKRIAVGKSLLKCTNMIRNVLDKITKHAKAIIVLINGIYKELKASKPAKGVYANHFYDQFDQGNPDGAAEAAKHLSAYKVNDLSYWVGISVYAIDCAETSGKNACLLPPTDKSIPYTPEHVCVIIGCTELNEARKDPRKMKAFLGKLFHEVGHGIKVGASGRFETLPKNRGGAAHRRWVPISFEAMADRNALQVGYGKELVKEFEKCIKTLTDLNFLQPNDVEKRIELMKRWLKVHGDDLISKL